MLPSFGAWDLRFSLPITTLWHLCIYTVAERGKHITTAQNTTLSKWIKIRKHKCAKTHANVETCAAFTKSAA